MKRTGTKPATERRANGDIDGRTPSVMGGCEVVHDLIESARDKIRVLDFEHRLESSKLKSKRGADGSAFDNRRVADALLPKFLDQSLRRLEDAPVLGDVLPHDEQIGRAHV